MSWDTVSQDTAVSSEYHLSDSFGGHGWYGFILGIPATVESPGYHRCPEDTRCGILGQPKYPEETIGVLGH